MKNGICPKCGSSEIISELPLRGGDSVQPYVNMTEPEPATRPFIWAPKFEQSTFKAYICGACGYTEFYASNYRSLNEARKKGFVGR